MPLYASMYRASLNILLIGLNNVISTITITSVWLSMQFIYSLVPIYKAPQKESTLDIKKINVLYRSTDMHRLLWGIAWSHCGDRAQRYTCLMLW